ncbi:carcinoembryonic antigen-related cell adhesion molecule 6-like [Gigantopelta aegis]|uniref:carcinoembryonic antigen-related cell adhesion molecule 6-like n=1 Tax=Gigantopelta aegis TaxID=1735272 RepID=UPI001B88C35F|nr:carcinoembryonic antigen-related cell adhesion molecule 6-like [Gigantopelta aegis]
MAFLQIIFEVTLIITSIGDNVVKGIATTTVDCMDDGIRGHSTRLVCTITGTIVGGINWIRPNGSPKHVIHCNYANNLCLPSGGITGYSVTIDSPTQHTLTIESFDIATDAGKWLCMDGTSISGHCNKTFKYGPDPSNVTLIPPPSTSVKEGWDLNVTCDAYCMPVCSYSWTESSRTVCLSSLLNLTNIRRNQDGKICICILNSAAIHVAFIKHLRLIEKFKGSVTFSSTASVEEGHYLTVDCTADCNLTCDYSWTLGGNQITTSPLLNLTDISRNQDGNVYNCTVTNSALPKTISEQFILTVHYGPVEGSVTFSSTASVEEGHYLTVDCTADCNPPCDYSWTLGGNQITTSPLLNLTDISWNQDGNVYNCTVTNSALPKTISEQFILTVHYDPERMSTLNAGAISGIVIAVVLALAIPTVWILYKRKIKKKAEDVQNESNN